MVFSLNNPLMRIRGMKYNKVLTHKNTSKRTHKLTQNHINTCHPPIQLLLTFDPILVEKVSVLMFEVMEDNPALSRAYLSG